MLLLHFGLVMLMTAIAGVGIVIIVGVAQLALLVSATVVQRERVLEAGRFPGIRIMTGRTLAAEMVRWPVPAVAGETIRRTCCAVIKSCWLPGVGVMASRTLS